MWNQKFYQKVISFLDTMSFLKVDISWCLHDFIQTLSYYLHTLGTGVINIVQARHPCLEVQENVAFIPNDASFDKGTVIKLARSCFHLLNITYIFTAAKSKSLMSEKVTLYIKTIELSWLQRLIDVMSFWTWASFKLMSMVYSEVHPSNIRPPAVIFPGCHFTFLKTIPWDQKTSSCAPGSFVNVTCPA